MKKPDTNYMIPLYEINRTGKSIKIERIGRGVGWNKESLLMSMQDEDTLKLVTDGYIIWEHTKNH